MSDSSHNDPDSSNFIRDAINADIASGKTSKVITRFPPEPNGYLHIGHAKSICLNFGIARDFGGYCNLRFDDTNPEKENVEYIEAIRRDVKWLGFDWAHNPFASDYFDKLYDYAVQLIKQGDAYVDSQSADDIRSSRGTLTEPGVAGPDRDRTASENLVLFEAMKVGKFADGEHVLRAKIDLAAPNINLRDPVIYRIRHVTHHNTGDTWCIYPLYDFTHGLSDAIEGVTHSLCTLEFEDHRPLYDWILERLDPPCHPRQIEFARLQLEYSLTSKRKLNQLVEQGHVDGWDDPRMMTISGMRRRGFTPQSIVSFCNAIGMTKKDSTIEMGVLENALRDDLNQRAERRMAVLDPLLVVIDNYPEEKIEMVSGSNYPQNPDDQSKREIPFSREIYIERDDFMEDAPKKFFRLSPGREVRLRFAYYVTCKEVVRNADGSIEKLICSYDPDSRGGKSADGRKVKGTIHWVSAAQAVPAKVNLYDRLFTAVNPGAAADFVSALNPESNVVAEAMLEPAVELTGNALAYQFERLGYFISDLDSSLESPIFNRTMTLRDSWAKIEQSK